MPSALTRTRWLYRLTVPWIWLPVALVSWKHPGDEYGLFGIANGLPSAFISIWLRPTGEPNNIFPKMIFCSFVAMLLISWVMDRLRVPLWLTVPLWILAGYVLFEMSYGDFESHARAIAKNGSMTAYVSASSNLGLFLACMLGIILTGGYHAARRFFPARNASAESIQAVSTQS